MKKKQFFYSLLGLLAIGTIGGLMLAFRHSSQHAKLGSHHGNHSASSHQDSDVDRHSNHSASSTQDSAIATTSSDGHAHQHGSHVHNSPPQTQAKLISASQVPTNQSVPVTIEIQDQQNQPVPEFEVFQEQLMHLIVVSDDLQYFNHIHPEYLQKGRFEVTTSFPQAGVYTLFSDYKPAQQSETVSILKIQSSGPAVAPPPIDRRTTKIFGNVQANLTLSQPEVKAGEDVTLSFNLSDVESRQPVVDLQPYLGEQGHLVIVKQSSSLSRADYIHAHALPEQQDGQIQFKTAFPEAGKYKLWGQFKRNSKIITADFWLEVS